MMEKRYQPHSQESMQLTKSSFAAIAGVLLSRASGVIRTTVVNASFGAGSVMDSFNAAFRLPNSLRDLFADGALSSAFIKVLVDAREKGVEEERKLISIIIGFFTSLTILIALLCTIYSTQFMELISDEKFKHSGNIVLASNLFKILAFYLPITMLNAVAMASLGVIGKTFRATNGSIFLSVGMVAGSLIFAPIFHYFHFDSIFGLAWGAMFGAFFQLVYQYIPLIKLNLIPLPNFKIKEWIKYKPLHEVLFLMGPRAIGQGALTLALLINTMFAIQVGSGALTYIVTAVMIIQVPIGLFGVATGFAALPSLTKLINDRKYIQFSKLLVESLETSILLALLTAIGFSLFIVPFYHVLFQHGKINFTDTIQNSLAVCAYSIGITFSAGSKVILNAFYALHNTKQIVYNSLIYLALSALLSSIFAPQYGILGLGLSYGISTAVDFFINLIFLRIIYRLKTQEISPYSESGKYFISKIVISSFLSFIIAFIGVELILKFWQHFEFYFHSNLTQFKSLFILLIGGAFYGLISLLIIMHFGTDNLKNLFLSIKKRIF